MSQARSNSSGFGNNPPRGPSLYDPERAAGMKKLNASMTPATTKSRAGRGKSAATRGGRGGRGRGQFLNVGGDRFPSTGGGIGMLGNHFVRPAHGPVITEPTFPPSTINRPPGFIPPHLRSGPAYNSVPPPAALKATASYQKSSPSAGAYSDNTGLNASWGEVKSAVDKFGMNPTHANWGDTPVLAAAISQAPPLESLTLGNAINPQVAARFQESERTSWGLVQPVQPTTEEQVLLPKTTWGSLIATHGGEEVCVQDANTTWGPYTDIEAAPAQPSQQSGTTWGGIPATHGQQNEVRAQQVNAALALHAESVAAPAHPVQQSGTTWGTVSVSNVPHAIVNPPIDTSWGEAPSFVPSVHAQQTQVPNPLSSDAEETPPSQAEAAWRKDLAEAYRMFTIQQARHQVGLGTSPEQQITTLREFSAAYLAFLAFARQGGNGLGTGSGVEHQVSPNAVPDSTSMDTDSGGVAGSGNVGSFAHYQVQSQANTLANAEDRSRARADSVHAHLSPPATPQAALTALLAQSGRVPIITNWGLDPVGPVIAGHLRQPNAFDAIIQIHQMTNIPIEELTSDGVSMPAAPPVNLDGFPIEVQESIRKEEEQRKRLLREYTATRKAALSQQTNGSVGMDTMHVDMDEYYTGAVIERPRVANLQDSIWNQPDASGSVARPTSSIDTVRARNLEAATAHYPSTPAYGASLQQSARAASQTMTTAAYELAPESAPYARPGNVAAQSGPKLGEKTLKDSKWA